MKIKIEEVMRFSGPRLIIYNPVELIKHALNTGAASERKGDLNWILTYDSKPQNNNYTTDAKSKSKDTEGVIRYSAAIDDVTKRKE